MDNQARAKTREGAERVGKYMIRPLLSLERLSLDEREEKVCYRYGGKAGRGGADGLSGVYRPRHLPYPGQGSGYCKVLRPLRERPQGQGAKGTTRFILIEEESQRVPRRLWAEMIRKVFEVDPLVCPRCQSRMELHEFSVRKNRGK